MPLASADQTGCTSKSFVGTTWSITYVGSGATPWPGTYEGDGGPNGKFTGCTNVPSSCPGGGACEPILTVGQTITITLSVNTGNACYQIDGGNTPYPAAICNSPTTGTVVTKLPVSQAMLDAAAASSGAAPGTTVPNGCTVPEEAAPSTSQLSGNIIDHLMFSGTSSNGIICGTPSSPPPTGVPEFPLAGGLGLAMVFLVAVPLLLAARKWRSPLLTQ